MNDQPIDSTEIKKAGNLAWLGVISLVLLRVCIGWQFLSEGFKKVEHDTTRGWQVSQAFVAFNEAFLNGAKGPLAGLYRNQTPSTHDWRRHVSIARETTPEDLDRLTNWVSRYVKRRQDELKAGKPGTPEFPDFHPAAGWATEIRGDWQRIVERVCALKDLNDDQRKQAAEVLRREEQNLADYLAEQALEMQDYQHQLWRLENDLSEPSAREVPFRQERIAEKESEVARLPQPWIAEIRAYDRYLSRGLRMLLTTEQRMAGPGAAVTRISSDPQVLAMIRNNQLIIIVIVGVGFCLLTGFCTPMAALAGAAFLLMVMASQPPWVPGAKSEFFYYQLIEFAALLLLAATFAGKYAGLDSLIDRWWSKRSTTKGA